MMKEFHRNAFLSSTQECCEISICSRRPGSDFAQSNGHGRNVFLAEARAASSNLVFRSAKGISAAEIKKNFLASCKEEGREWCLLVREMDNPALGISRQEDLSSEFKEIASLGPSSGEHVLVVYKVNVADGSEQLMRPGHLLGMNLRVLRDASGLGNDPATFSYMQSRDKASREPRWRLTAPSTPACQHCKRPCFAFSGCRSA